MSEVHHTESPWSTLRRIPNGLLVLLTVALLLQGPVGAFEALRDYAIDLLTAVFGGEELFWQVLCQTAPLTLAAAAISFSIRCGWFTLNGTSLIGASLLILAGTWLGGQLRTSIASSTQLTSTSGSTEKRFSLSEDLPRDHVHAETISVTQAIDILSNLRGSATAGSQHQWDLPIPRVALLPEPASAVGMIPRAINQILGYLVIYRPRLFLAAIVLGAYIGWCWQPYYTYFRVRLSRKATPAGA